MQIKLTYNDIIEKEIQIMNYNFTQYMKFLMFMRYKLIVDKDYPNLD